MREKWERLCILKNILKKCYPYPPRHKCRHVIAMMHTPEGCSAWANKKYYPTLADGTKSQFMMIN